MVISQQLLSDLKARFLAKLHRRRFNRACVAHPWDAQAQLVGDSFRGLQGQPPMVKWRIDGLDDGWSEEMKLKDQDVGSCEEWNMLKWKEPIFVQKASVLRRQADVMVTSGLALGIGTHAGMVEAFRFFSSNVPFVGCFAIKLWDNNFDNKMRRASSTFRLLFSTLFWLTLSKMPWIICSSSSCWFRTPGKPCMTLRLSMGAVTMCTHAKGPMEQLMQQEKHTQICVDYKHLKHHETSVSQKNMPMPKNTWGIYYLYYLLKKTTATFRCSKQLPDGRSWPFRPVARQCAGQWLKCAFAALRNLWSFYLGVIFFGNLAELLVICVLLVNCLMLYVDIFLKNDGTHELFILWGYHLWEGFFQDIYMSMEATLGAWVQWAASLISLNIQGSGSHPEDGQRRLLSIERLVQSLDVLGS